MEEEETQQNLSGEQLLALVTQPVGDIHHRTSALEKMGGRKVQQQQEHDRQVGDRWVLVSREQVGDMEALVSQPLVGI